MAMESSLMLFDFSKWMQQKREPQLALQLPCPIKHTLIIVLRRPPHSPCIGGGLTCPGLILPPIRGIRGGLLFIQYE